MYKRIGMLLDTHYNTVLNWSNQDRLVIQFFKKYFTKHDIQEFIDTKKITWLENRRDPNALLKILTPSAHMANRFAEYIIDKHSIINISAVVEYLGANNDEEFMPHKFLQQIAKIEAEDPVAFSKEYKKMCEFMMSLSKTDIAFLNYILKNEFNETDSLAKKYGYPNLEIFNINVATSNKFGFAKSNSLISSAWKSYAQAHREPNWNLKLFKEELEKEIQSLGA